MIEERIRARIEEIKRERDQYVIGANNRVAEMTGAIQALEALLVPEEADAMAKGGPGKAEE